jgi:hypothetical protein
LLLAYPQVLRAHIIQKFYVEKQRNVTHPISHAARKKITAFRYISCNIGGNQLSVNDDDDDHQLLQYTISMQRFKNTRLTNGSSRRVTSRSCWCSTVNSSSSVQHLIDIAGHSISFGRRHQLVYYLLISILLFYKSRHYNIVFAVGVLAHHYTYYIITYSNI